MKKTISALILFILLSVPALGETIYETKSTAPVASGITRTAIRRFATEGFQYINVVEADLSNKYVSAGVVLPEKGISAVESPLEMAKKNNTSVIVNGDFFASAGGGGSSTGPLVKDGELLSTSGEETMASLGIFDGSVFMDYFNITARITAENGESADVRHINKYDPLDAICIYTGEFYKTTPGAVNNIWEVLVVDGVIEQINSQGEIIEIPEGGYVLRCLPEYNSFVPDNLKVGDTLKLEISASFDYKKADMLMGGGTLLVKEGEKAEITHNVSGNNPRTAAGVDKTGKKLYLVTVDGRNSYSAGMTLSQLSDFLVEYGVYNAINLDGGGSTAMIVRDFSSGEQSAVHSKASSYLRPVVNGFGIYSNAPKGDAASFEIKGEDVFEGLSTDFEIINAVDKYGNPYTGEIIPEFSIDSNYGYFNGSTLHAKKSGKNIEINATYNGFTAKTYINICPLDKTEAFPKHFDVEQEPLFELYGYTKEGRKLLINKRDVTVKENKVYAGGKETELLFTDIDESFSTALEVTAYPKDTVKATGIVDKSKTLDGNGSLKLTFDFTDSSPDAKAAYVNINKEVKGKYGLLSAYLGENRQWLRAEFADADGNVLKTDICEDMNFNGWKLLSFEVPETAVTLTRIYVVQNMYDNKNKASVYFDSLSYTDELSDGYEAPEAQVEFSKEKGETDFTVFAGVSPVKNLLSVSLKKTLETSLLKENAAYNFSLEGVTFERLDTKTIKSHSSFADENGIYINLDNSDGYLSKAQFVKFKNDLLTDKKNVFIFMNEELSLMKSEEELEILKTLMCELSEEKNIFVFYPAENNGIYKENGVNFIKTAGVKNSSAKGVVYFPGDFGYYTVKTGENPEILYKSIFRE